MNNEDRILEIAMKLKALADRGVGGEKSNATEMLKRYMEKHDLTSEDIGSDALLELEVTYKRGMKDLTIQIAKHVTGGKASVWEYVADTRGCLCVECTRVHHVEIQCMIDFYTVKFKEEQKIFYKAFIHKNKLGVNSEGKERSEPTPEELEEQWKVTNMMEGLTKHRMRKQIG